MFKKNITQHLRLNGKIVVVLLFSCFQFIHCSSCSTNSNTLPRFYTYQIIDTFPHDDNAFTQGLFFENGVFYESTGRYGSSSVRKVNPPTGEIVKIHDLPVQFFGEGLTVVDGKIIQLTWRSKVGFVYDKETFELEKEFSYQTEGWGITYDGSRLIMSDGTENLYFLDVVTFELIGQIEVSDRGAPVTRLNELEFINGEVFANVWGSDSIVRINPQTGKVVGWIALQGLLDKEKLVRPVDVLNGIAYDEKNDRLFVTGKLWPKVFQIKLVPVEH